jgi:glycosyltransferase involved in cell wall biosynthesis
MRVNWILPFIHPGGGVRVVLEHAKYLQEHGHTVTIVYPGPHGAQLAYSEPERSLRAIKYRLDALLGKNEASWFDGNLSITRVPDLSTAHIPDGDIVIATSNETADWVATYPDRCGKKAYFIQDYETWNRDVALVDATWKLPLTKIAIAPWLIALGKDKFQETVLGPVPNGIDTAKFYPDPDIPHSAREYDVVLVYRSAPQKNCDAAIALLTELQREQKVSVVSFGLELPPPELQALGEYHQNPSQDTIRNIYSNARIILLPSHQEGYNLPPLEAAACKTAVVTTDVGSARDIYPDTRYDHFIVPTHDTNALKKALVAALENAQETQAAATAAYAHVTKTRTWAVSSSILESILLDLHS